MSISQAHKFLMKHCVVKIDKQRFSKKHEIGTSPGLGRFSSLFLGPDQLIHLDGELFLMERSIGLI